MVREHERSSPRPDWRCQCMLRVLAYLRDPCMNLTLADLKKAGHGLFVPELGGSYDVWKTRPLPRALIECVLPPWMFVPDKTRPTTCANISVAATADGSHCSPLLCDTRPRSFRRYAAADVVHLHAMRTSWGNLMSMEDMDAITSRRIEAAISGALAAKGAHMARRDF